MSDSFVKLYQSLLDSSVWFESPTTRLVWITVLLLADADGLVDVSVPGLARRANVSLADCEAALAVLCADDPHSKTPDHGGRRVEKLHRGYRVLNYLAYRERRSTKRSYGNYGGSYVYYARSGDEVKIGKSRNPWARINEMRTARPDIEIVATEPGDESLETQRHHEFTASRIDASREWFRWTPEIAAHVEAIGGSSSTVATSSDGRSRSSASTSTSTSVEVSGKRPEYPIVKEDTPEPADGHVVVDPLDAVLAEAGLDLAGFRPIDAKGLRAFLRTQRSPFASAAILRVQLVDEECPVPALAEAVREYAALGTDRIEGNHFKAFVRKARASVAQKPMRAAARQEERFITSEDHEAERARREEAEMVRELAAFQQRQPDEYAAVMETAERSVPATVGEKFRPTMVRAALVTLARKHGFIAGGARAAR
jgi:hypothetical protein